MMPVHKSTVQIAEKKGPQNWIRRQFSGQMNQDYDSRGVEQVISVAAAAYVIKSIEESNITEQTKPRGIAKQSSSRIKSKKGDKAIVVQGQASEEFSGESSAKSPEILDGKVQKTATRKEKAPIEGHAPPIKSTLTLSDKPASSTEKIPTSAEKSLNRRSDVKPEIAEPNATKAAIKPEIPRPKPGVATVNPEIQSLMPKPDPVTPTKPLTSPANTERQKSPPRRTGQTQADAWEIAELAKIQKRYEEVSARILSWEGKKKQKAKERLDKTESELARIRLKASARYQDDIADINQIAGAARAKAAERKRNEEEKTKQKAHSIRKTGEVPSRCFCF
ncbi:hypothetical protein Tsubulata_050328 [Turnera subulata]|uniref:Remorin C-terminal domain-containing protein n=1 Tax=Turnera subulata TaxID=218843 RepID=A0A9Q0FDJ7_9ROSI|nr:hypothetical protein Tsubulata_050328 [Turnera subulata]